MLSTDGDDLPSTLNSFLLNDKHDGWTVMCHDSVVLLTSNAICLLCFLLQTVCVLSTGGDDLPGLLGPSAVLVRVAPSFMR